MHIIRFQEPDSLFFERRLTFQEIPSQKPPESTPSQPAVTSDSQESINTIAELLHALDDPAKSDQKGVFDSIRRVYDGIHETLTPDQRENVLAMVNKKYQELDKKELAAKKMNVRMELMKLAEEINPEKKNDTNEGPQPASRAPSETGNKPPVEVSDIRSEKTGGRMGLKERIINALEDIGGVGFVTGIIRKYVSFRRMLLGVMPPKDAKIAEAKLQKFDAILEFFGPEELHEMIEERFPKSAIKVVPGFRDRSAYKRLRIDYRKSLRDQLSEDEKKNFLGAVGELEEAHPFDEFVEKKIDDYMKKMSTYTSDKSETYVTTLQGIYGGERPKVQSEAAAVDTDQGQKGDGGGVGSFFSSLFSFSK